MDKTEAIYVAGHRGMVGSAIVRRLQADGFTNVIMRTRGELDLREPGAVRAFYAESKPAVVVVAAAKVGGIVANNEMPAEFLLENLQIQNNLISCAHESDVRKLLFLGSSCIYPKFAPQPIREDSLLTGPLEPTNEAYALAKIAGIKLCQAYAKEYGRNFICGMPTNLYGPNDNFDLHTSHVLPALIRKVHLAKQTGAATVPIWGTGAPKREFLHADDLADACCFLLEKYDSPEIVNIGCGEDVTIRELAETVCDVVGFEGSLEFDASKPDGTPRKLLDMTKLFGMGWRPRIPLRDGIREAYEWFLANVESR